MAAKIYAAKSKKSVQCVEKLAYSRKGNESAIAYRMYDRHHFLIFARCGLKSWASGIKLIEEIKGMRVDGRYVHGENGYAISYTRARCGRERNVAFERI